MVGKRRNRRKPNYVLVFRAIGVVFVFVGAILAGIGLAVRGEVFVLAGAAFMATAPSHRRLRTFETNKPNMPTFLKLPLQSDRRGDDPIIVIINIDHIIRVAPNEMGGSTVYFTPSTRMSGYNTERTVAELIQILAENGCKMAE